MDIMLHALAPEICVTLMASAILLFDVFNKNLNKIFIYIFSVTTLIVAGVLTKFTAKEMVVLFNGGYIVDSFASNLKILIYVILAAIFIYSYNYMKSRKLLHGEFFVLALFSLLGMMCLISSGNFLTFYLGLELFVLPIYAMIVFARDNTKYIEAAVKYFIIGSLGSGLLLYGISLVYGASGTINFILLASSAYNGILLQLGMLFIIVGIALEFAAVPFHMWLPDVYEGSPTTVTMIVATIPKIAVFAITYRLLTLAFPNLTANWQMWFMVLALLSIIFGNLIAIAQSNIKRMLAYSTINHVGFILLGLFAAPTIGYIPAIFYTIVYAFMTLAAFAVIMRLTALGFEAELIEDFRGLNKTAPWSAFVMLLIMFALAGIPPLVGFYAKLQILQGVIQAGFTWIAILAMIFSIIGAFYYLRVVKAMYFSEPNLTASHAAADMSITARILMSCNGLLLLLAGIYPASIIYFCMDMFK